MWITPSLPSLGGCSSVSKRQPNGKMPLSTPSRADSRTSVPGYAAQRRGREAVVEACPTLLHPSSAQLYGTPSPPPQASTLRVAVKRTAGQGVSGLSAHWPRPTAAGRSAFQLGVTSEGTIQGPTRGRHEPLASAHQRRLKRTVQRSCTSRARLAFLGSREGVSWWGGGLAGLGRGMALGCFL